MDLEDQLRQHYNQQQIPADRARALVETGRRASVIRSRRKGWWMMAAAVVVVGLGLAGGWRYSHRQSNEVSPSVLIAQDLATAVTGFFSQPAPALGLVSPDWQVLVEWLRLRGGPADFQPPPAMAGLATFGCQVLDVRGTSVYLICFVADTSPADAKGTAPALVHLVLAPANKFSPDSWSSKRTDLPPGGDWHFTTWTQGDLVILAASTLPPERLSGLVEG